MAGTVEATVGRAGTGAVKKAGTVAPVRRTASRACRSAKKSLAVTMAVTTEGTTARRTLATERPGACWTRSEVEEELQGFQGMINEQDQLYNVLLL